MGLVLRNKQDNELGMLHPVPGTEEAFVAIVCVGILAVSPFPRASLVFKQCVRLQGVWSALGCFYTPGKIEDVAATVPLATLFSCPPGLPFRLLLGEQRVAFSTSTAGSFTETQRDGFKLRRNCFSQKECLQGSHDTC